MRDAEQKLEALHCDNLAEMQPQNLAEDSFFHALPASGKLVLMTSFYTAYVKQAGDLADLCLGNLHMEDLEGFRKDDFSVEYVSNLAAWEQLENTDFIMLISSLGYTQKFFSQRLLEKIDRPVPYKLERKRGYPAFLVGAKAEQDFIAISHAGRAARINAEQLPLRENRLLNLSLKGQVIGAVAASPEDELIIASQNGIAKRISVNSIPRSEMNSTGEKLAQRANLVSALIYRPEQNLWAATNQRLIPIEQSAIPLDNNDTSDYSFAKLKKGEKILSLFYSH